MSTTTKIAAVAGLLTALAAPEMAFAQQEMFFPDAYTSTQSGVPTDAQGSVPAPARHHAPRKAERSVR
jgi:hypothetical protein